MINYGWFINQGVSETINNEGEGQEGRFYRMY